MVIGKHDLFIQSQVLLFFFLFLYGKLRGKTLNLVSMVSSSMENGTGGRALLIQGKNWAATWSGGGNVKQVHTRCCGSSAVKIAFVGTCASYWISGLVVNEIDSTFFKYPFSLKRFLGCIPSLLSMN